MNCFARAATIAITSDSSSAPRCSAKDRRLRVRLRMSWVADASDEEASHGDEDHGLGDVEAPLVVAHEAAKAGHPAEASLDDPAAGHNLEAGLAVEAANDLDDE